MPKVASAAKKVIMVAALAACACQNIDADITENQAVEIASRKIESDFPRMEPSKMRRLTLKSGNAWVVTYFPDAGALGGPTNVVIDKRSGEVIVVLGSQ